MQMNLRTTRQKEDLFGNFPIKKGTPRNPINSKPQNRPQRFFFFVRTPMVQKAVPLIFGKLPFSNPSRKGAPIGDREDVWGSRV